MSKHRIATFIGKSYAHVQHGLDCLLEWGVTKMKQAEPVPPDRRNNANRYVHLAETAVRGTLGFIGTMATSYFEKYRELKASEKDAGHSAG